MRLVANDGRSREVPVITIHTFDLHQDRGRLPWLFPRRAGRCFVSILINTEKMNPAGRDRVSASRAGSGMSLSSRPIRREYEPLEEAFEEGEAPEQRTQLHVEAPDAGAPHIPYEDREFAHGRSRG